MIRIQKRAGVRELTPSDIVHIQERMKCEIILIDSKLSSEIIGDRNKNKFCQSSFISSKERIKRKFLPADS